MNEQRRTFLSRPEHQTGLHQPTSASIRIHPRPSTLLHICTASASRLPHPRADGAPHPFIQIRMSAQVSSLAQPAPSVRCHVARTFGTGGCVRGTEKESSGRKGRRAGGGSGGHPSARALGVSAGAGAVQLQAPRLEAWTSLSLNLIKSCNLRSGTFTCTSDTACEIPRALACDREGGGVRATVQSRARREGEPRELAFGSPGRGARGRRGRDLWWRFGDTAQAHIMNAGVSGFKNAIVTKGIVVTCGFLSLVLAARRDAKQFSLSYQKIVQRLELWRLVMAPLVFPSLPELFLGLYLLYFFRVFERQVGSTKYMVFVVLTTTISTFLELFFLFLLKGISVEGPFGHSSCMGDGPRGYETGGAWRLYPASLICWFSGDVSSVSNIRLNSGPSGLIFSAFVLFFFDIPVSTRFKVLGVEVSEKSFVYFVGLQLLLWSWMQSMIPAVCGIIVGLLYRYDVAGVQEIGFSPGAFCQMAWRVAPFFSGISPEMASRMNFSRTTETDTRNEDHHEVNFQNRYPRYGWNAERRLCRCTDCISFRRKSVQANGSRLQSKTCNHGAYPIPE